LSRLRGKDRRLGPSLHHRVANPTIPEEESRGPPLMKIFAVGCRLNGERFVKQGKPLHQAQIVLMP